MLLLLWSSHFLGKIKKTNEALLWIVGMWSCNLKCFAHNPVSFRLSHSFSSPLPLAKGDWAVHPPMHWHEALPVFVEACVCIDKMPFLSHLMPSLSVPWLLLCMLFFFLCQPLLLCFVCFGVFVLVFLSCLSLFSSNNFVPLCLLFSHAW